MPNTKQKVKLSLLTQKYNGNFIDKLHAFVKINIWVKNINLQKRIIPLS